MSRAVPLEEGTRFPRRTRSSGREVTGPSAAALKEWQEPVEKKSYARGGSIELREVEE